MNVIFDFLNSNFFQTLITLIAGLVALYVYQKQKQDHKRGAANSVFLEIQHIERCLPKVKEAIRRGGLNNLDFTLIRDDAWSRYSHLFSGNFDQVEWEVITDFYLNARLLDESIAASNKSFSDDIAQIRYNKQRMFAEITKDMIDSPPSGEGVDAIGIYNQRVELFDKLYMSRQEEFAYTPVKYLNDAKKCVEDMDKLSITTIGTKLKRVGNIR